MPSPCARLGHPLGALLVTAAAAVLASALVAGCAAPRVYQAQRLMQTHMTTLRGADVDALLARCDDLYRDHDRVLFELERATILHFHRDFAASTRAFHRAERHIERAYTKSVSRGLGSILVNDLQLAYDGEAYEDVYLNAFKSLNFLHRGDVDGALVEARRMTHKLGLVEARYRGLADVLSHADTTRAVTAGVASWTPRGAAPEHSAFARFLTTALLATQGDADGARIEHAKLRAALADQGRPASAPRPEAAAPAHLRDGAAFNTLLVAFSGRGPTKQERRLHIHLDDPDLDFDIAVPVLVTPPTRVHRVRAVVGDTLTVDVPLVEDVQATAAAVYRAKEPIVRARAVVRALIKTAAREAGTRALADEGHEELASVVGFLGRVATVATERADTRTWQTLPGRAHAAAVPLPPGEHTVRFEYLSAGGAILFSETQPVTASAAASGALALAESLFWD